jgi:hypothetical protein
MDDRRATSFKGFRAERTVFDHEQGCSKAVTIVGTVKYKQHPILEIPSANESKCAISESLLQ